MACDTTGTSEVYFDGRFWSNLVFFDVVKAVSH